MTDLLQLKVSLTKHNAHKIARLLKEYRIDQILGKLDDVHAEGAQARKNLSVQADDKIPTVWIDAKRLGESAIDALVLVGIIFSHHELIDAMVKASARSRFSGRIERGVQLDNKAYTNFARVIDQLGFATKPVGREQPRSGVSRRTAHCKSNPRTSFPALQSNG